MDLFSLYALAAAHEALSQANWFPVEQAQKRRTATIIGSGIGGFPTITQAQKHLLSAAIANSPPSRCPPF
ncbi:hypothetical protein HORIV_52730 [Vreelandella olivaria]|uniref:Beta-ketoacyl synthase-like N-terminal domain-containing protein n=1 Tax=Vreelandella olivaria TaxID=390919 RepID=A0ABN5X410_9GAMM|nr:hypothetical protein HORIV_52730 [Halomonas olivaria]